MGKLTVSYGDQTIINTSQSGEFTLETEDKVMHGDVSVVYNESETLVDDYASGAKPDGELVISGNLVSRGLAGRRGVIPSVTIQNATSIPNYAFQGSSGIQSVYAPNVTTIGYGAFMSCSGLTAITPDCFPNLTTANTYSSVGLFGDCPNLAVIHLPKLTTINPANNQWPDGAYQIGSSTVNPILVLPSIRTFPNVRSYTTTYGAIDLGPNLQTTALSGTNYFYQCYCRVLIIRKSDAIVAASDSNCIRRLSSSTAVYVPAALLDEYSNATNWSTKGNIFHSIEGSIYETQYADGTPIVQEETT